MFIVVRTGKSRVELRAFRHLFPLMACVVLQAALLGSGYCQTSSTGDRAESDSPPGIGVCA